MVFEQIYLTHRWNPNWDYHSGSDYIYIYIYIYVYIYIYIAKYFIVLFAYTN